jgi:SAM-dependent methyltransferase
MDAESENVNRSTWRSSRVQRVFAARTGFTDPGEELVMRRIAEHASGEPILDVGVGAGRTLPYLQDLTGDYVAVDFLDEMVALTRARYPRSRIEQDDARSLASFADGRFAAVFFSFNGIDGIAHEDRPKVHAAAWRVLRPGGLFAYSTHNLSHRLAGLPPWDPRRFRVDDRGIRPLVAAAVRMPRSVVSYRRLLPLSEHGEGWARLVDSAYSFSVVWHYVTTSEAQREALDAGFDSAIELLDTRAAAAAAGDRAEDSPWIHVLARKPLEVTGSQSPRYRLPEP